MQEIYRNIPEYEGLYQVSNLGNVMSLAKGDGNGNKDRLLRYDITENTHTNYARVTLCKKGVIKRFLVHRLVAKVFVANTGKKPHINHIDNDGLNNKAPNLEWVTAAENMQHSAKQGRQQIAQRMGILAAVPKNYARYAKIHMDYLGDNFIAYYPSHMIAENLTLDKASAGVEYLCKTCNGRRLAFTSWAELRRYKGICPNCYTRQLTLLDEDIV